MSEKMNIFVAENVLGCKWWTKNLYRKFPEKRFLASPDVYYSPDAEWNGHPATGTEDVDTSTLPNYFESSRDALDIIEKLLKDGFQIKMNAVRSAESTKGEDVNDWKVDILKECECIGHSLEQSFSKAICVAALRSFDLRPAS